MELTCWPISMEVLILKKWANTSYGPESQRLMSKWKYKFSYDHLNQAPWGQPVFRWVLLSGEWWVLRWKQSKRKAMSWLLGETGNSAIQVDHRISPTQLQICFYFRGSPTIYTSELCTYTSSQVVFLLNKKKHFQQQLKPTRNQNVPQPVVQPVSGLNYSSPKSPTSHTLEYVHLYL